jgi:hypothetical protein
METKFQTSFIPKKPLVSDSKVTNTVHHGSVSLVMVIGTILFIASLGGAVYSVVWKQVLIKAQEKYKAELVESEKRFNVALIESLKKVDTKIDVSTLLLNKHLSVSEIFPILNKLTIESVRFNSFEFDKVSGESSDIKITMKGVARNYNSIAFQSDVFGSSQLYGNNKVIKNPIVSDLVEDDNGEVSFSFTGTLNPADLSYEKILTETLNSEQQ